MLRRDDLWVVGVHCVFLGHILSLATVAVGDTQHLWLYMHKHVHVHTACVFPIIRGVTGVSYVLQMVVTACSDAW